MSRLDGFYGVQSGDLARSALGGNYLITEEVLQLAGLTGSDQQLPSSIRVRHGTNSAGKRMHYYLNYSGEPQTFMYAYGAGTDLLTGTKVPPSLQVAVPAWDLLIIEEGRTHR